mmetsp:Transcript_107460/g.239928  ORF Transcript_107460/g.239928 Transcript_107460/m.239928 type:complete len:213 (+) Transcript_107460:620-1258(+)
MLHARLRTEDVGLPHGLYRARRRGAVRIGSLHKAHPQVLDPGLFQKPRQEAHEEESQAVPIQQSEGTATVSEEVDDPVGVTIDAHATLARLHVHATGRCLLYLHEVRTATFVEGASTIVPELHPQASKRKLGSHRAECREADTIGAIDHHLRSVPLRRCRSCPHQALVGRHQLVRVTQQARDTVAARRLFASHHVVQLWCGGQAQRSHGRWP